MPTFFPPVSYTLPQITADTRGVQYRLFRYYGGNPVGRSVVLVSGHYVTIDYPSQETLASLTIGQDYFLGGHYYDVTAAVAAALTADGYGAYLS